MPDTYIPDTYVPDTTPPSSDSGSSSDTGPAPQSTPEPAVQLAPVADTQSSGAQTLELTAAQLNALLAESVNGVMVMLVSGNLNSLQINVPLSWFMNNEGATLLVYNAGLGLLAITSENMIELAALSYDGVGGVTMQIHGKTLTFSPDTIISYNMDRGSVILTVLANGETIYWYIYDSPVILGIPGNTGGNTNPDLWVVTETFADGSEKIIARSQIRDGLVYAMVNSEGTYEIKYNAVQFSDIFDGTTEDWVKSAVTYMAARGIVAGIGNEMFASDRPITRAEYITMLMRTMDYNMAEYPDMPFDDIDPESWYYEHVCVAAALGITLGVGEGQFAPERYITRQEMFTLTYNALTRFYLMFPADEDPEDDFNGIDGVAAYALRAVMSMIDAGLVTPLEGSVNPHGASTRAEAVLFLMNVINYIVPDYSELLNPVTED